MPSQSSDKEKKELNSLKAGVPIIADEFFWEAAAATIRHRSRERHTMANTPPPPLPTFVEPWAKSLQTNIQRWHFL